MSDFQMRNLMTCNSFDQEQLYQSGLASMKAGTGSPDEELACCLGINVETVVNDLHKSLIRFQIQF